MANKIYKCYKCGKIYTADKKPIRWVINKYGVGRYNQYYPISHIDLCITCSNKILKFIKNNEEEI